MQNQTASNYQKRANIIMTSATIKQYNEIAILFLHKWQQHATTVGATNQHHTITIATQQQQKPNTPPNETWYKNSNLHQQIKRYFVSEEPGFPLKALDDPAGWTLLAMGARRP